MAKNKNRDRKQPRSERARQDAQPSVMEPPAEERTTQVTPGAMSPKGRHKRFGHN
ncbi:hypothetical protein [Streptomyces sp. NPDC006610]|jgi:hypothetical protein|uniref:hypothetical protein n=1 Tax=Streptomyces sp. NPDC006610 TaxID=3154584 RepID=UPI0033A7D3B2